MAAIDDSFDLALGRLGLSPSKRDMIAIEGVTNAELFYMLDRQATDDLIAMRSMGTVDKSTKYKLLAFQDWLHEQGNCVSLDAFTVEVMEDHVAKMKERDATIDKEFDKALSKIGLMANQRDAVSDQGIPDAATFALLDKEAMDDLLTDPELVTMNAFTKYKLRAFQTWIIENPDVPLESYTLQRGTHQMSNIKRKESGLDPLPFAAAATPEIAEEEKVDIGEEKEEQKTPEDAEPASTTVESTKKSSNEGSLRLAKVRKTAILRGHTSSVRGILHYERQGKGYLASCSYDKSVKIWDVATSAEVTTLKGHSGCVNAIAHYKIGDTTYLATASNDKNIIIWDLDNKSTKKLKQHTSDVRALAIINMPNGDVLMASGSSDSTIIIWDLKTMTAKKTLTGHTSYVYALTSFKYGNTPILASGGNDNKIFLWDLNKMTKFSDFVAHPLYIWTLIHFEMNGKHYLASGSADKTIKLWELGSQQNPVQTFTGHTGCVNALQFFTQNGVSCLVSGDSKGVIQFRNLKENKLMTSLELYSSAVTSIATFTSGKSYLAIGHFSEIEFWSE
jgi:WD40 repeat protein